MLHHRACHLCEAICGVVIETEGDDIVSIKGDPDDPLSRGHICPKAVALKDIHEDPDRLRQPIRKITDENGEPRWQAISWEEALDTTARALFELRDQYGAHALGIYSGNPSVHNYGMLTHARELSRHFRTNNRFSATSVDQLPHHLAYLWLYGHKFLYTVADIDRTDYMLMLGANPLASNGSLWTVPDVRQRIKDLTQRGGRLVVIDPRRTETANLASEHHFIRPGSDALFLLALLQTLLDEQLADPGKLADFTDGLDTVAAALSDFTPEFAAQHTGIAADTIRSIARDFAASKAAVCYGRMGVSTQAYGALCQWAIQVINIATGNLDREGGAMFATPAIDQVPTSGPGGFGRHHSRKRGLPEFDRELPVVALAEEILEPGEGQIRALFTGAGNPVLSTPNGRALEAALETLQFMVSIDIYLNETTRHADIILPPTSPLEHDHYDLAFHAMAVRNTARYNPPVFDKPEGSLHDWEIFAELGRRLDLLAGDEPQPTMTPEQILEFGLAAGPYAAQGLDLAALKASPSGVDLGELKPQLPERLQTPGKRIDCASPAPLQDMKRLREEFACADDDSLRLIGRRHVRSNNSWMHNHQRLMKGPDRSALLMHPVDMQARGIIDGSDVLLRSRVGEVRVAVRATEDMMPGVVSLPHGFGHHREGTGQRLAAEHAGVSCNDVTDELYIDALSGNAALNGVAVSVLPSS
ncbi:MAG: molybdopterin-dependent oxidoreductase [Pseudomonadota bacterium]